MAVVNKNFVVIAQSLLREINKQNHHEKGKGYACSVWNTLECYYLMPIVM